VSADTANTWSMGKMHVYSQANNSRKKLKNALQNKFEKNTAHQKSYKKTKQLKDVVIEYMEEFVSMHIKK
jgi:hypothetical protein